MALQYLFDPNKQFQSIGGVNEVSGFLRVFLNGTDDRATTYRNFDGGLNEPDIVLDSYGRAVVIVDDTKTYRIEVYNRLGGLMWTVSNYKASGGSGGGSGTPVSVEGTVGEIDVDENTEGGVKHFVVGLASTIKNAITALQLAVNRIGLSLNGKKDRQAPVSVSGGTTKTLVGITQDENGEISPEFDDIAFPDWTSAINAAVATCEKLENKKTTLTGYESSNTYYPTIKAVVDFVNAAMQNLGGKLITDNGDPFTDSSDLPSTTPYGGVDIADKDYAYVQNVGTAERWSATVSGSSVMWQQEYAISIPVFTPAQQAAIDSGATETKIGNYDSHIANATIHVTANDKNTWNAKQNAISDLAKIRSGAAAGATALQPNGNGSNVTSTFTAASSRTNISSGEKLSVIFGKITKWFADLKALAFKDKVSDSDISGTIADAHIASASTWNGKQNSLPTSGTPTDTYAINISGTAVIANHLKRAYVNKSSQTTKVWKKIATSKTFTTWDACSICFLYNHSGYTYELGLDSIVSVSIHTSNAGSFANARIDTYSYRSASETQLVRIGSTNQYEVWVKVPTTDTNMYATVLNFYGGWTINTDESQTGQLTDDEFTAYKSSNPSIGTAYNYNIVKAGKSGVGSSTVPVYVDGNGEFKECTSVAQKASSGSGTLAIIDSNGNYSSSGISAYDQTMLNGLTSRLGSFVSAINSFSHSFNVIFYGSDISKTFDFENTYASIKFLRFGISYISGKISYRLPWSGSSADFNGWIIAPDTLTKNGKSIVHTTHTFTVAGNTNAEELYEESELGTTGQSVASIFEKQITTSQTVRGRLSSEIRLYNGVSYKELIVHVDIGYERLSSTGAFFAFGTITCNTDLFEND